MDYVVYVALSLILWIKKFSNFCPVVEGMVRFICVGIPTNSSVYYSVVGFGLEYFEVTTFIFFINEVWLSDFLLDIFHI